MLIFKKIIYYLDYIKIIIEGSVVIIVLFISYWFIHTIVPWINVFHKYFMLCSLSDTEPHH